MEKNLEKKLRGGNLVYRIVEGFEPLVEKRVVEWGWDIVYRIGDCVDIEDNYEFIPLTAEWLVRFGFRKSSNFVYYFDSFSWDSRDSLFTVYSDWNGEYAYYVKVEWVHQLQNLYFALTGKELVLTAENGG